MRVRHIISLIATGILMLGHLSGKAAERAIIPSFHIPSQMTPFSFTMRNPFLPETAGTISFYLAISPVGAADTVTFFHRNEGSPTFTSLNMTFYQVSGANDYFSCELMVPVGPVVEYYFRVMATGYDTTYVYGSDFTSETTTIEATAQTGSFDFFAGSHPSTPTPTPTNTPTSNVTPTATPEPTFTSIPQTPTPTVQPQSPTPSSTFSPPPTPTPTVDPGGIELDLRLNQTFFYPRDAFLLDLQVAYSIQETLDLRLFILLEVYGNFFFGSDNWRRWSGEITFEPITLMAGGTTPLTYVILDFPWPDEEVPPSTQDVLFWSALLDENSTLLGNVDRVDFGWGM